MLKIKTYPINLFRGDLEDNICKSGKGGYKYRQLLLMFYGETLGLMVWKVMLLRIVFPILISSALLILAYQLTKISIYLGFVSVLMVFVVLVFPVLLCREDVSDLYAFKRNYVLAVWGGASNIFSLLWVNKNRRFFLGVVWAGFLVCIVFTIFFVRNESGAWCRFFKICAQRNENIDIYLLIFALNLIVPFLLLTFWLYLQFRSRDIPCGLRQSEIKEGALNVSIAHMSDLHFVSHAYEWRLETGVSDVPNFKQGNGIANDAFNYILNMDAKPKILVITGDITDSGRRLEWVEFLVAISILKNSGIKIVVCPGNHDLSIQDRYNPGRIGDIGGVFQLIRHMRFLSAMLSIQGADSYVFPDEPNFSNGELPDNMIPFDAFCSGINRDFRDFEKFPDCGNKRRLLDRKLWFVYPILMVLDREARLAALIINSNSPANFSVTNAFGYIDQRQLRIIDSVIGNCSNWKFIVLLHHQVFSILESGGGEKEDYVTSLTNRGELLGVLKKYGTRVAIFHGHRHVDGKWSLGDLSIISAGSTTLGSANEKAEFGHDSGFRVFDFSVGPEGLFYTNDFFCKINT